MALFVKATTVSASGGEGSQYHAPLLDEGNYKARLIRIIDLGMQPPGPKGKAPKPKIAMVFECQDEFLMTSDAEDAEEVLDMPRDFSYEMGCEKDGYMTDQYNIYKVMKALDGFEKALPDLLGTPCEITLAIKTSADKKKQYNVITAVSPMKPKDKLKCTEPLMEQWLFSIDKDTTVEMFEKLSTRGGKWSHQELVKTSLELWDDAPQLAEALKVPKVEKIDVGTKAMDSQEDVFVEPEGAVPEVDASDDPFA